MDESVQEALTRALFEQRETKKNHADAFAFECYECVRQGDVNRLARCPQDLDSTRFSGDFVRSVQYQFAISIDTAARFCMEGGMESETAYNLRDYYIKCADACISADEVNALHRVALGDYAARMHKHGTKQDVSPLIARCVEYICSNLHEHLSLHEIASDLHISESHLSRTFHREVGMTVGSYITARRVQEAENLLRYTEYPSLDIANYLCFSSHSHFIAVFKAQTGMTPKQYRACYQIL